MTETLKWQARYYPFGEMSESGFEENTHGFSGKEFDEEMDLNYFCQRYYDPEIGRFMILDPVDSPASSPYGYCANNPLKFIDPTGAVMQVPIPPSEGGGWSHLSGWWTYDIWTAKSADMDPNLFGGPDHDIIPFGEGAFVWDYETDSWQGYGEPFTSAEAFAKAFWGDDYITNGGRYDWRYDMGKSPELTMTDINNAKGWLIQNIDWFKEVFSGDLTFKWIIYDWKPLKNPAETHKINSRYYQVWLCGYLRSDVIKWYIAHECFETHTIYI